MHLKNFSLRHRAQGPVLSPAYDLLNVNLVNAKDKEELALTLKGEKVHNKTYRLYRPRRTALNIKLMLNGMPINQPVKKPKHMIMAIFRWHNDEIKALVGSEYSANTLERYEVSYRHTVNFLQHKYKVSDMDINA